MSAIAQAQAFDISSNDDFSIVDQHCAGLLKLKKRIEADFKESKETTFSAWKAVVSQEKGHMDGIEDARRIDKQKMAAWQKKIEGERQAEETKLRVEAQKRAEDEALARAQALAASGQHDEADSILASPPEVAPIVIAKTAPKSETVIREIWKFRIINPLLIPNEYKTIDEKKIGGGVRALGSATNIPGVEAYQESV